MTDDADEIVVQVEAEPTDAGGAKTPVESDAVAELKSQFEEISKTAASEKAAREASERREREATERAGRAERRAKEADGEIAATQFDSVTTGLQAAEAEATAAKKEIRAYAEAGDFEKQAEAFDRLAEAKAKMVRLNEAKADLEARKAAPRTETRATDDRPRDNQGRFVSDDPIEQFISTKTEPTAKWLREHRDWVVDPKKNARLTSAHYDAVAEGLTPDTETYFEHVERRLGLREAPERQNGAQNGNGKQPAQRRASPPVAPVNGGGGAHSSGNVRNEVVLTRGEAAAANDGMTHVWGPHDLAAGRIKDKTLIGKAIGNQEFARRKQAMMKQGLYDKTYIEN